MAKMSQSRPADYGLYDADYFDRIRGWAQSTKYENELEELIKGLGLEENDLVLDIGCGACNALSYVSERVNCRIVGIDFSIVGLKYCHTRNVFIGDVHNLPFKDSSFDSVYMMHVIGHVNSPVKVLQEIKRVLKPQGKLGIVTPNRFFVYLMKPLNYLKIVKHKPDPTVLRYYSAGSLEAQLKNNGFTDSMVFTYGDLPSLIRFSGRLGWSDRFKERVISLSTKRRSE